MFHVEILNEGGEVGVAIGCGGQTVDDSRLNGQSGGIITINFIGMTITFVQ